MIESVSIEPVQPIRCTEPHEPLIILHDLLDGALRQSFPTGEMGEAYVLAIDH
jgi:hypothetical protein